MAETDLLPDQAGIVHAWTAWWKHERRRIWKLPRGAWRWWVWRQPSHPSPSLLTRRELCRAALELMHFAPPNGCLSTPGIMSALVKLHNSLSSRSTPGSAAHPNNWVFWVYITNVAMTSTGAMTRNPVRMAGFVIPVEPVEVGRVFDQILAVARQQRLTEYDAAYLELALREALPLATLDDDLRQAAQSVGIKIVTL